MINFNFRHAHGVIADLTTVVQTSKKAVKAGSTASVPDEDIITCRDIAERANALFSELHFSHIDHATRRLKAYAYKQMEWSELNTIARALRDAIDIELRDHLFYRYIKPKGQVLFNWKTEWESVVQAFPDTKFAIEGEVEHSRSPFLVEWPDLCRPHGALLAAETAWFDGPCESSLVGGQGAPLRPTAPSAAPSFRGPPRMTDRPRACERRCGARHLTENGHCQRQSGR